MVYSAFAGPGGHNDGEATVNYSNGHVTHQHRMMPGEGDAARVIFFSFSGVKSFYLFILTRLI